MAVPRVGREHGEDLGLSPRDYLFKQEGAAEARDGEMLSDGEGGEAVDLHPSMEAMEAQQPTVLGNLLPLGIMVKQLRGLREESPSQGGMGGPTDKVRGQQEGGKSLG